MCRFLTERGVFDADPIVFLDVGARDGYCSEWRVFEGGMRVFCFEPDKRECERLNREAPSNVTYIPTALGRERKHQTLYEARLSYSSGLYPSNSDFFKRLLNGPNGEVVGQEEIWTETLSYVMAERNIHAVNFVKLDAEGAELDILLGGADFLEKPCCLGVLTEMRLHPEINGSPPFWQMEQYMQAHGFRLFDLSANRQSRVALPYGVTEDHFLPDGRRFFAYTEHGQVMDGDALYFRDLLLPKNEAVKAKLRPVDVLKLAALYELYHHNDAAAELVLHNREVLSPLANCEKLLNLLTPVWKGERLAYSAYMASYFHPHNRRTAPPEAEALRAELEKVYASVSWRITSPLRKLKALLRAALKKSQLLRALAKPVRVLRAYLLR